MSRPKDPITVERIRTYLDECEAKGKASREIDGLRFLLAELDKHRFNDEGQRELTIEGGERWLDKWKDVPMARWPHAVKLLMIYSANLHWHRDQREKMIQRMEKLLGEASAFKQVVKIGHETLILEKEPV
jgi:hypothetical protein